MIALLTASFALRKIRFIFIRFLAQDPQIAREMGQAGREYLEANFTPKIIAQQYQEVLTKSSQS